MDPIHEHSKEYFENHRLAKRELSELLNGKQVYGIDLYLQFQYELNILSLIDLINSHHRELVCISLDRESIWYISVPDTMKYIAEKETTTTENSSKEDILDLLLHVHR